MAELTERQKLVLKAIVKDFIISALPVGSWRIKKSKWLNVSPATIRSTMAELDAQGYLYQPYTSSGRVPTEMGYRFYVDLLMSEGTLSERERTAITESLRPYATDIEELLSTTSELLGNLSAQVGVALAPRIMEGRLVRIELLSIATQAVLVVLQMEAGFAKTVVLEIDSDIPADVLALISSRLNESLAGLNLREIKDTISERIGNLSYENTGLIRLLIDHADRVFDFNEQEKLKYSGSENLAKKPEFRDVEKLGRVIRLLENEKILINALHKGDSPDEVIIQIGSEIDIPESDDLSLVSAKYGFGNYSGTLAVLGSSRMHYEKIVATVIYTANLLTKTLSN